LLYIASPSAGTINASIVHTSEFVQVAPNRTLALDDAVVACASRAASAVSSHPPSTATTELLETNASETRVTTETAPNEVDGILDVNFYPHIIDNILDYLVMDHPAALRLTTVCRSWQHRIRPSVFAHIRAEMALDPPQMKSEHGWFQLSTVSPPGGRCLRWPELVNADSAGDEAVVALPNSLVAVAPYIQVFDVHGPLRQYYTIMVTLWRLKHDITMFRVNDYLPRGHRFRDAALGDSYSYDRFWCASPSLHLARHQRRKRENRPPLPVALHIPVFEEAVSFVDIVERSPVPRSARLHFLFQPVDPDFPPESPHKYHRVVEVFLYRSSQ